MSRGCGTDAGHELMAAMEAAEKERIQQMKAEKAKMAADRHAEQVAALANLQKALVR